MAQLFNIGSIIKSAKLIALVVISSVFVVSEVAAVWKGEGLSDAEREAKIREVFASRPKLTLSEEASAILNRELVIGDGEWRREDALEAMNELIALSKNYYDAKRGIRFGDSNAEDAFQEIKGELEDFVEEGIWTREEMKIVMREVDRIHEEVLFRIEEASVYESSERVARRVQEEAASEREDVKEELAEWAGAVACPNSTALKAKYQSGCWSCLVLEKLISAFLHAANKGLPIVQKAGLVLLWVGFAIWIAMWGLKNVSSFTEIQIGNILNDLIKELFKIAIAYWFIYNSTTAISQYFITPLLSVGAVIGQQFWPAEIEQYTESWSHITDEEYQEMAKQFEEDEKSQTTPVTPVQTSTPVEQKSLTEEQQKLLDSQPQKLEVMGDIPDFTLPGCSGCRLTSPSGPRESCGGVCSSCHGGADFGAKKPGVEGDPIWAIAPGTIQGLRIQSGGINKGGGAYIVVKHNAKDKEWHSVYMHLQERSVRNNTLVKVGQKVVAGQQIGWMGNTGSSTGAHLHLEIWEGAPFGSWTKQYSPVWISRKRKIPAKKWCKESVSGVDPWAGYPSTKQVFHERTVSGDIPDDLSTTYTSGGSMGYAGSQHASLIVNIDEIKYTGPTNIMPKSVMNSILGATRAITNTTSEMMVLGNLITCYANDENGGAWRVFGFSFVNIAMWISGGIIWVLGFLLTLAVAYYLLDISFKIGFAVLSIPVLMGLWPYGFTQGKIYIAISIIAKASATFAFLALTTAFGMTMLSEALGNIDILYNTYDALTEDATTDQADGLKDYISNQVMPFSSTFLLACFTMIYFYKLVQQTISDLVNKFFPDKAFGDSSPMHSAATMMTSWAKNIATKATGLDLAKDIVANQTGNLVKGGLKATGKAAAAVPRAVGKGIKKAFSGKKAGNK